MLSAKRFAIASIVTCLYCQASVNSAQDQYLVGRLKQIYGPSAPDKITYVDANQATSANSAADASRAGDSAAGVIVSEKGGTLFLDTRPCLGHVVAFSGRYRKTKVGSVSCKDKQFDRYEVEQQPYPGSQ